MCQLFQQLAVFCSLIVNPMHEFELRNTIKVERARRDMTQAELAVKVGVSRKTINTIETGKFVPSTVTALRIAKVLYLTIDDIFFLHEK